MVAEVFGSIGAFKAMFDIAKALKDMNDAAIRNGAVIELQEQIPRRPTRASGVAGASRLS